MRSLCVVVDLCGAPASSIILREMLGEKSAHGENTTLHMAGPAGFACRSGRARGSRPMVSVSADDRLVVVADSRLDNRAELLGHLSEPFRSAPDPDDAELIAASYRVWGRDFPAHLLGDFAFALWDARKKLLLAARDPLGIRRLHYATAGSRLCIATEPSQLLCHPAISADLDDATIADYLCGLLDPPERTMFRQVRALRPGHWLLAVGGKVATQRFWDADPTHIIRYKDRSQYAEQLRETLRQAVSDRLPKAARSSIGISLSGGLDSCSVAALAADELSGDPLQRRLVSASLTFEELPTCDERPYIEEMTRSLGISSAWVPADRFGFFADTPSHPDPNTPFMAWESAFRTLFQTLRGFGTSTVLTGLGGDEFLTGNRLAYFDRLISGDLASVGEVISFTKRHHLPITGPLYRCFLAPAFGQTFDRNLRRLLGKSVGTEAPHWLKADFRRRSGVDDRLADRLGKRRFPSRAHQTLYDSIVVRGDHLRSVAWFDRRANAQGLEAQHPFFDRRILELLLAIPVSELFRVGPKKPLLRMAMKSMLPGSVYSRNEKTSLAAYNDLRLQEHESSIVDQLLTQPILGELDIVEPEELQRIYKQQRRAQATTELRTLWNVITLESWLRAHFNCKRICPSPHRAETLVA